MRNPWLVSAITLTLVLSPALSEENGDPTQGEDPPSMRSGGKGKGKGKGKGRAPEPAPGVPTTNAPPATGSPNTPLTAEEDFFEKRIRPVLEQHCMECHQTGRKMKGGLAVDSHAALLRGGDSGPSLVPGKPGESLLYVSITQTDPDLQMPPRDQLPVTVVEDFKRWIEMGAPWPNAATSSSTVATNPNGPREHVVTLSGVRGNTVTFVFSDDASPARGGGRFRGSSSGGESDSLRVAENAIITDASTERRTGEILIGIDLAGGLRNEAFDHIDEGSTRARIVIRDETIVELNLVTRTEEDAPIAVKPKRPPQLP